jgi:hypothetical protein
MSDKKTNPGYETTDAHTGLIWIVAVVLVICVALSVFVTDLTFRFLHHRDAAAQQRNEIERVTQSVSGTQTKFPEPRLQVAPQLDLAEMRAREETELRSYGWVDQKAGVVRLPIDRAMELMVQRRLPVRGDPNAPKATRTPLDMQQSRPTQRDSTPVPQ